MSELTLHEKLIDIQQRLKVPKEQENDFGGFEYRSIEDIEAKVKPFLKEHGLSLRFTDRVYGVEGRVYVEATAILSDGKDEITTKASAREAEKPKTKTDDAQLTGACSSYARKYAAGGMFLIDEGKDADTNKPKISLPRAKSNLMAAFKTQGILDTLDIMATIQQATGKDIVETVEDAETVIKYLEKET